MTSVSLSAPVLTPSPYTRPAQVAARAAPDLSTVRDSSGALQGEAKTLSDAFMAGRQTARDIVKAQAKERVQQLREQISILTRLLGADPAALAKQVARIAKELRGVLKTYNDAHKGDVEDAALKREQAGVEAQARTAETAVTDAENYRRAGARRVSKKRPKPRT